MIRFLYVRDKPPTEIRKDLVPFILRMSPIKETVSLMLATGGPSLDL